MASNDNLSDVGLDAGTAVSALVKTVTLELSLRTVPLLSIRDAHW